MQQSPLVSVSIQVKVGLIDYGYFFVIFLSCYVSIYTWCNGIFAALLHKGLKG